MREARALLEEARAANGAPSQVESALAAVESALAALGAGPRLERAVEPDDNDDAPTTRAPSAAAVVHLEEWKLAEFFENAAIGLHWVGPDGTILWANQAELDLLGYARDEYVGHHIAEFHADRHAIEDILARQTTDEVLRNYEARLRCKDGSIRHVLISASVLRKDGEFVHTRCFTKDVTDRRRVEAVLERERRNTQLILASAGEGICGVDVEGRTTFVNPAAARMTGYAPEELIGRAQHDLLHHARADGAPYPREACPIDGVLRDGGVRHRDDEVFWRKDGTCFPVDYTSTPIREDGRIVGAVVVFRDVTERKRAERRLAAQHAVTRVLAESRTLAQAAPRVLRAICEGADWAWGALWRPDDAAGVLRCAEAWYDPRVDAAALEALTRAATFARGEGLPGRTWAQGRVIALADVAAEASLPRLAAAARHGLHGAVTFPVRVGDDVAGVFEFFSREVRPPDADLCAMMAAIGTQLGQFLERTRLEDAARATEARKAAIVESALDCIVVMDHRGTVVEFNPAAAATFGFTREEALGREMAELIVPPALRAAHRAGLARLLATGETRVLGKRLELTAVRRDGSEFPVELTIARVAGEDPPVFTGFLRDVTERRWVEQERERLLREAQDAVRARDAFLAIASHELRTPLTALQLQVQSVLREAERAAVPLGAQARIAPKFEVIERAILRLTRLVNELLEISRITAGRFDLQPDDVDLTGLVAEVIARARRDLERAGCRVQLEAPAPLVGRWDRARLEQVVDVLLSNAMKYGSGGPIEVAVRERDGRAELVVRDHGIGVAPEHQARIFDRFERAVSDRNYGGFGLGLWIARALVVAMGGAIELASAPGAGATFTVTLPLAPAP